MLPSSHDAASCSQPACKAPVSPLNHAHAFSHSQQTSWDEGLGQGLGRGCFDPLRFEGWRPDRREGFYFLLTRKAFLHVTWHTLTRNAVRLLHHADIVVHFRDRGSFVGCKKISSPGGDVCVVVSIDGMRASEDFLDHLVFDQMFPFFGEMLKLHITRLGRFPSVVDELPTSQLVMSGELKRPIDAHRCMQSAEEGDFSSGNQKLSETGSPILVICSDLARPRSTMSSRLHGFS
jgi:hypothetical protein